MIGGMIPKDVVAIGVEESTAEKENGPKGGLEEGGERERRGVVVGIGSPDPRLSDHFAPDN
jgi:hypothetical protein